MTRRAIVNITSKKKRDNMMPVPIDDDPTSIGTGGTPYQMTGDNPYGFLFSPTARRSAFTQNLDYSRDSSSTFSKGYAEKITMETSNSANWLWRRIVFATKHVFYKQYPEGVLELEDPTAGYQRTMWNHLGSDATAEPSRAALEDMLFEGQSGADWNDRFVAKTDKRYVTVLHDSRRALNGQNDSARWYHLKKWHPINKSIVYNEKEEGKEGSDTAAYAQWSVDGKPGIGNVFIYDMFACAQGTINDQLEFNPQGVYYWHER